MRKFEPFLIHPTLQEFKTQKIGEGLDRPEEYGRSHFMNVTESIEYNNSTVEEDLRISYKNIEYLRESIADIDNKSIENLSTFTKEFGNKVIFVYDNMANAINDQRCENLKLQAEIANISREKNSLKHQIKSLVHSIKKLEVFLGVDPDPKFDTMITENYIY